jgi:hypothetical protein
MGEKKQSTQTGMPKGMAAKQQGQSRKAQD